MSDEYRCRTRPYYYLRRAYTDWRLTAALTLLGIVAALLIPTPKLALILFTTGSFLTAWNYIDDTPVVFEPGDQS